MFKQRQHCSEIPGTYSVDADPVRAGAPRERYFDGLAEIIASGHQLSEEEWTRFYADNDQYMV